MKAMWDIVVKHCANYPERLKVAKVLIESGLTVKNNKVYCNKIEISPTRISRTAGVDRRTVTATIKTIETNHELRTLFENIESAGASLKEAARYLGLGVVEITPTNAKTPGILAKSASLIANKGISIRQAIVDDPELSPEPKLTFITERKIPGELIPKFLKVHGVAKVAVY
jgi:predicted regulator of amino acid metabolism with ACT domain